MHKTREAYGPADAFTIVELLIVIVVIGILAAITIVAYNGVQQRAHTSAVQADISGVTSQLAQDNATNGSYPSSLATANNGKGIPAAQTDGTNLAYSYVPGTNSYCLTGTNSGIAYFTIPGSPPTPGDCTGLTGWWKFDGGADDSSSGGNTASPVSATLSTGQDGRSSSAYAFDGTSSYMTTSGIGTLGLTDNFSVSAWVYLSASPGTGWNHIIAGKVYDWGLGVNVSSGSPYLQLTEVSYADAPRSANVITTQTWHFVTATYSGGTVTYYLDGTPDGSGSFTPAHAIVPSTKYIGNTDQGYSAFFHGSLDDIRVYSRVLGASEVKSLFSAGAQ